MKGTGNQQDYGMRIYDPRVGRFLSVDPLTKGFPMLTPYQFASNTPIQAIDLDGLEKYHYTLTFNEQGKTVLKLDRVENFTRTETSWTPTWSDWTKTTTTTTRNPYKSYVVHGQAKYALGLDGDMGDYQGQFTWTFDNEGDMRTAEERGGIGKEPFWGWYSSDQGTEMAITIGLYNGVQAELEHGGSRGSWRKRYYTPPTLLDRLKLRKDYSLINKFFKSNLSGTIPSVKAANGKVITGKIDIYKSENIVIPEGLSIETLKLYKQQAAEIRAGYKPEASGYKEQTNRINLIDQLIAEKK